MATRFLMTKRRLFNAVTIQERAYQLLEPGTREDRASNAVDLLILALIVINVTALILETVDSLHAQWQPWFDWIELITVGVFSLEYVLRVWSINADKRYRHPVGGRLRYMLTPLAIFDLLAISSFYLYLLGVDAGFLRMFRVARLAKLWRYSTTLRTFGKVIKNKREELAVTLVIMFLLLITASALLYYAERSVQPEAFSSIPAAMWWGVVTVTTVGYGDIYPVTPIGKFMGALFAVIGIGMFALPTGILGSGFIEEFHRKNRSRKCPHCGQALE